MRVQSPWYVQVVALAATVALYWAFLGAIQGIVIVISMILHECGHWAVFEWAGIKTKIMILFPIGAVAAPVDEESDKKSDQLPYWKIGWLTLIGLIINAGLLLIGKMIMSNGGLLSEIGSALVFINSLLIVLNLLPVSNLDGGLFFKAISSSMEREAAKNLAVILVLGSMMILMFLSGIMVDWSWKTALIQLLREYQIVIFLLIFCSSIWRTMNHKDAKMPVTPGAMNNMQILILLMVYLALVMVLVL